MANVCDNTDHWDNNIILQYPRRPAAARGGPRRPAARRRCRGGIADYTEADRARETGTGRQTDTQRDQRDQADRERDRERQAEREREREI